MTEYVTLHRRPPADRLSSRQLEAVRTYLKVKSRKEAAARMGITDETMKRHLTEAYRKLGIEDEGHMCIVAAAEAIGWLVVPEA